MVETVSTVGGALCRERPWTTHDWLTDHKASVVTRTEATCGSNDLQPFNRGQLEMVVPEIRELLVPI